MKMQEIKKRVKEALRKQGATDKGVKRTQQEIEKKLDDRKVWSIDHLRQGASDAEKYFDAAGHLQDMTHAETETVTRVFLGEDDDGNNIYLKKKIKQGRVRYYLASAPGKSWRDEKDRLEDINNKYADQQMNLNNQRRELEQKIQTLNSMLSNAPANAKEYLQTEKEQAELELEKLQEMESKQKSK